MPPPSAPRPPSVGETVNSYQIVAELGAGGMGVVYKAVDTKLQRTVALKFLPLALNSDERARTLFMGEARAASALDHPNIGTIHGIEETPEGSLFIVMAYYEGDTLETRVHRGPLPPTEAVSIAAQMARGLAEAHSHNIVHRDIKPSNTILTGKGLAKIVDFGLARVIRSAVSTRTASILGTPGFMSPEQALGKTVDHRSDLWSLGVVLYEMLAGHPPFQADSVPALLLAIVNSAPAPMDNVSEDLQQIVYHAIAKDPAHRYQSAAEMLADLEAAAHTGKGRSSLTLNPSELAKYVDRASQPSAFQTTPVSFPRRSRRRVLPIAIAAAVLVATVAGGILWLGRNSGKPAAEGALIRLTTDPGLNTSPAFSPDGKLLAYASDRAGEGNLDIWVQQLGGGEPIRLTRNSADDDEPNFSPDGTQIAFHSDRDGGGIYVISTLGGAERKIADLGRRPRFSPDGRRIAYWVGKPDDPAFDGDYRTGKLFVVDSDGGPPQELFSDFSAAIEPIWTPDGGHLLFQGTKTASDKNSIGWWVGSPQGGKPVQVKPPQGQAKFFWTCHPFEWIGNRVILTYWFKDERGTRTRNVQEVALSPKTWQITAAPHALTSGTITADAPTVTSDGRIAFTSLTLNLDVYSLPVDANRGAPTGPRERWTRDLGDDVGPTLSADGTRAAFLSRRSGGDKIHTKDLKTGEEALLTFSSFPFLSPDGSTIVWEDDEPSTRSVPFTGGPTRLICRDCGTPAGWSPDGKSMLVFPMVASHRSVRILDVASAQTTEYVNQPKYNLTPMAFAPNGQWISVHGRTKDRADVLLVMPFRPASPPSEKEWIQITTEGIIPRWSPDSNLLYFISGRDGFLCIWAQRLDQATKHPSGDPFAVAHLHTTSLRMLGNATYLSVARDKLAFCLEERIGSLWMRK